MSKGLNQRRPTPCSGFSYVELMIVVAISGIIALALTGLIDTATGFSDTLRTRNEMNRDARYAMQKMLRSVAHTSRLLLPLNDNPNTDWPEHIREQTIPPSPPIGSSVFASAVLAVTLPRDIDLDQDGVADADDDGDGLFSEDLPNDNQHDFSPGIVGIDDDGDGLIDEGNGFDDDEDGSEDEDPRDGIDNDGDGSVDEDTATDINDDGCPGICGVDDDRMSNIDEGGADDDDEDGAGFDDPYDPVVYYLDGNTLVERMPARWDTDGISAPDGPVDGRDFVETPIASNVTRFRVERLITNGPIELIELTLELTEPVSGESVSLRTNVRVGGAL